MRDKARWLKGKGTITAAKAMLEGRTKPLAACRSLLSVDDGIGQILAALEDKDPGLQNSVIVFTSDQGIQYGEHNWFQKKVPYEGTIRVPFVVRADGLLAGEPSVDTSNLVLNIDLAPTILDLTAQAGSPGCPRQDPYRQRCEQRGGGFDGLSLAPLLGPTVAPTPPFSDRVFLIEMWDALASFPEYCAVRSVDAKLIRYDKDVGADLEAYDLNTDPHELHSKVYSDPDGVARTRPGGQAIFDALYPRLTELCDPLPPEYVAFPAQA